jgi:glycosyltransferase involved in cell wall biosynthesis
LDSVLSQSYQDFEIIVADDGSQDGSHEILADYASRYPDKVRYCYHPGHAHKGFAATSDLAIREAGGEFIARHDSDDIWLPEKLAQQVALLDTRQDVDFVYAYNLFIDRAGNDLPGLRGVDVTQDGNPLGRILVSQHVPENSAVYRRRVFEKVGLYNESLMYSDWDLMVRIFAHFKAAFIAKPVAKYRIHTTNQSVQIDPKINLERILAVFHHLERTSADVGGALLEPRNLALLDLQLCFLAFCAGNTEEAALHLQSAFLKDADLDGDVERFDAWLNQWKPDFYTVDHPHFGFWAIEHLPALKSAMFRAALIQRQLAHPETRKFYVRRGIQQGKSQAQLIETKHLFGDIPQDAALPEGWQAGILKEVYPALLFDQYEAGDVAKVRRYWKETVQLDPSWLKNRGIWSIGLKMLLGGKPAKTNRRVGA